MNPNAMDVFFLLIGAIMILAMHAGFAFLEVGTVSKKHQVNAFQKIMFDWAVTTVIYFFIGFPLSRGISIYTNPQLLTEYNGYTLVSFFFFVGFAACIPAIISGGVVGRMKFYAQTIAGVFLAAVIYPLMEGFMWGDGTCGVSSIVSFSSIFPSGIHDFAGSVVVHSLGGWIALTAVYLLGPRKGRYEGKLDLRPSSIPFLALGSWILVIGWFGFNVMSSTKLADISGLVAINSLMSMVGGTLAGMIFSKNDSGFTHNGALAGLIAICAGSDVVHPISALVIGGVAGFIFIKMFEIEVEKMKLDDVLGVWPLHGINGTWGGIAAGIFGKKSLGAVSDLNFMAQFVGSLLVVVYALIAGFILYKLIDLVYGLKMTEHQQKIGSDLTFHHISSHPEESL